MRTRIITRITLLFMSLASLSLVAGCKKAAPQIPPPVVQIETVASASAPLSTEFIGQLDSPQNVELRARVEAFVEKMPFTDGTEVKEGDLLFELDKKPFQQQLTAAQGALGQAQAALKRYETDVARLKPLAEKRAVPQQDLDHAVASADAGKADVLTQQARVDSAQIDLGYCDVRAPVTGLIGAKLVSMGELVGKGSPTLLATISTLDPIWFYCNISEVQYLRARADSSHSGRRIEDVPVTLILSDGTVHGNPGKVVFIDRAVDPKTGTLRVRAEFENPERLLRPGMFARVRVDLGTRADSILVPERAVAELQGKNFVWVIASDNKATQRAVKLGEQIGNKFLILEGLKPGERYVTEGLQKVREGLVVQANSAEQMAQAAAAQETSAHKSEKE